MARTLGLSWPDFLAVDRGPDRVDLDQAQVGQRRRTGPDRRACRPGRSPRHPAGIVASLPRAVILPPSKTSVPFSIDRAADRMDRGVGQRDRLSSAARREFRDGRKRDRPQREQNRDAKADTSHGDFDMTLNLACLVHCASLMHPTADHCHRLVTQCSCPCAQNSSCRGHSSHSSGWRSPAACIAWPESRILRIRAARILACSLAERLVVVAVEVLAAVDPGLLAARA